MDLSPQRTTVTVTHDRPWLAGLVGVPANETGTLDITNGGFGFTVAGGTVLSGTPVKKHAGTGLYRRVVTTASSEEEADGHVYSDVVVKPGTTKEGFALFVLHGPVIDAKVPGTFVDLNRSRHIRYI